MKTNRFILAALFIFAAVSCQKESFAGLENPRETESATIVAGEMTKTSLNGNNVCWTSDDVIAVYDNFGYKNEFNIQNAEANYAAFSGEVTVGTTQVYAVYPYQLAGDISGSTISVTIPVDQTSKAGSFAEEHNISVAKGEKTPGVEAIQDVTFKNVASILKFTVPSYIEDVKSVTFSTSRPIAGAATVDASADAPVAVVAEDGSKSVTMTGSYTAGSQFMFVLSAGEINGFTVTVVTDKATWSISRDVNVTLEAGQYKNLGMLILEEVTATASAEHTYVGGVLTGTSVSVDVNVPSTVNVYDPVVSMTLSVKNASGTELRSITKTADYASSLIAADASWPYLPSGDYTVDGTCTLASGAEKKFTASFSAAKPNDYTVNSPSPYTSYDKYLNEGKNAANACKPLTVYNVRSASVNISSEILNNANYASINNGFSYTLKSNNSSEIVSVTGDAADAKALGVNTVTAVYVFDGVTKTAEKSCHVTGLPYTLNVAANDTVSQWSESGNVVWKNTDGAQAVRLGYALGDDFNTGASSITKTFSIPAQINVSASATGRVRGSSFIADIETTGSVAVSDTQIGSTKAKGQEGSWYNKTDKIVAFSYSNQSIPMTTGNPTVKCNNSNSTNHASTYVESLTILYADK